MIQENYPSRLDVKQAAHQAWQLQGQNLLSTYERLTFETQGLEGENYLSWSVRMALLHDPAGLEQIWMYLTVDVNFPQICQRCLTPVAVAVHIDRAFRFVESESIAAQQDEQSEEDVLVLSREFDLGALIEDEVLMDLPLVARHDTCPVELKLAVADANFEEAPAQPNPFSVLTQLKSRH